MKGDVLIGDKHYKPVILTHYLDENGKDIPVTVSAFSTEKITIRVVINTAEMTEKELNEAVSSMIISTKGMNKKVFGISIPCVPYFIFVSNNIWLDLD